MTEHIKLRPVREEELVLLDQLTRGTDDPGDVNSFGWQPSRWRQRFDHDQLLGPDGGVLMVQAGSEPAGIAQWWRPSPQWPQTSCWRLAMYLLPDARGHGCGTRAHRLLTGYLLAHTPAHRLEAETDLDNQAAQHVLERNGYTREGVLRASHWRHGAWRDSVLYSLLRTDPAPGRSDVGPG
ncbi:GNAT family N-acetyltransferase [Spirillospora sp. NPDC050679]